MRAGLVGIIGIILLVLILNTYFTFRRAQKRGKGRGRSRTYQLPDEAKRAEWREKEIARRLQNEQDEALERIKRRNETLSYYEAVRNMYNKKEAMERLGIKAEDEEKDAVAGSGPDKSPYKDIRDDIYIYEDRNIKEGDKSEYSE